MHVLVGEYTSDKSSMPPLGAITTATVFNKWWIATGVVGIVTLAMVAYFSLAHGRTCSR